MFANICDDEKEHVKTMTACRDYSIVGDLVNREEAQKGKGDVKPPEDEERIKTMDRTQLS